MNGLEGTHRFRDRMWKKKKLKKKKHWPFFCRRKVSRNDDKDFERSGRTDVVARGNSIPKTPGADP